MPSRSASHAGRASAAPNTPPAWLAKPTPSPARNAARPFNAYAPAASRRFTPGASASAGLTTAPSPATAPPGRPAPGAGGRPGPALLWLRADLRLHDHPALKAASAGGRAVLPVLVLDERDYRAGAPRAEAAAGAESYQPRRAAPCAPPPPSPTARFGPARAAFTLAAAADLRARLRDAGSDLVVRLGRPEDVLPALAAAVRAEAVFATAEVAAPDVAAERAVEAALAGGGGAARPGPAARLVLVGEGGAQLYDPADVARAGGRLPLTFAEFKEAVAGVAVRAPTPAPARAPPLPRTPVPAGDLPSVAALTGVEGRAAAAPPPPPSLTFKGGEGAGLARLASVRGAQGPAAVAAALASLGPWLAAGCVSARRVLAELGGGGGGGGGTAPSPAWAHLAFRDFWRLAAGAGVRERGRAGAGVVA